MTKLEENAREGYLYGRHGWRVIPGMWSYANVPEIAAWLKAHSDGLADRAAGRLSCAHGYQLSTFDSPCGCT